MFILASVFLLSSLLTPISPDDLTTEKLGDDVLLVYAHKGFWRVNSLAVRTTDGLVVIDTFPSPAFAEPALEKIKGFSDLPIRYVINTHCHADHCFGNPAFTGIPIIGHTRCLEEIEAEPARIRKSVYGALVRFENMLEKVESGSEHEDRIEGMLDFLKHLKNQLDGNFKPIPPNIVFDKSATLIVGDKTFEMYYIGPVHSRALIAVHIPQAGVLVAPGLFHINNLPVLNCDEGPNANELYESLNLLIKNCGDSRFVIPGHEKVCGMDKIRKQFKYVHDLSLVVKVCRVKGKTLDEAVDELKLGEFESFSNYGDVHPSNIKEEWKRQEREETKENES